MADATREFGPDNGTLSVHTSRSGAAAKAGHDLRLEVTRWEATLAPDGLTLSADSTSLRVREATGGMMALDDDGRDNIHQTIDDEVLKRGDIAFRSTAIDGDQVSGELTLGGQTHPLSFTLAEDGDRLSATAVVTQSDFGMKPYSALFGALKVADEVRIEFQSR